MSELPPLVDHIAGTQRAPSRSLEFQVTDASTGQGLQPAMATDKEVVDEAIGAADDAFQAGAWSQMPVAERASYLDSIAEYVSAHVPAMAEIDARTTGITRKWTQLMTQLAPITFRVAAAALRSGILESRVPGKLGEVEVHSLPLGPAGLIAPWNAPSAITAHKLASALAAGCPVVLKPSEHAPHSAGFLLEAIEATGLPQGTVQLVHGAGPVGAQIVGDRRIKAVSFTGGLKAGRSVASACGFDLKPMQLELGGNNPMIVLDDADLNAAADAALAGLTTLNGQWCRALGRLLVHRSVRHELLELLRERLAEVRLGHALEEDSDMGPLAHPGHLSTVRQLVQAHVDRGATRIAPTALPELEGHFFPPTLLTGIAAEDALDEIFGPVATVHTFERDSDALHLANQTPFGLSAYVFGSEDRALRLARHVHAGDVKVNGLSLLSLSPQAPRPAWGLSGLGDEGTVESLRFFTGHRVVGIAGGRTSA